MTTDLSAPIRKLKKKLKNIQAQIELEERWKISAGDTIERDFAALEVKRLREEEESYQEAIRLLEEA